MMKKKKNAYSLSWRLCSVVSLELCVLDNSVQMCSFSFSLFAQPHSYHLVSFKKKKKKRTKNKGRISSSKVVLTFHRHYSRVHWPLMWVYMCVEWLCVLCMWVCTPLSVFLHVCVEAPRGHGPFVLFSNELWLTCLAPTWRLFVLCVPRRKRSATSCSSQTCWSCCRPALAWAASSTRWDSRDAQTRLGPHPTWKALAMSDCWRSTFYDFM